MAYNYFPTGYQPMQFYPQTPQNFTPQQNNGQSNSGIIWVQGLAGAKSYLVAPNQTVQLWDSESQSIYLKSADASGMPSIKILDYTIRDNTPKSAEIQPVNDFATKDELQAIQKEIESLKAKIKPVDRKEKSNGKSDI